VPIKLLTGSVAATLCVLLAGCATPPAKPAPAQATAASTPGEKGQTSAPPDSKAAAAAVQKGDEAFQAQDFDRAIYNYIQALEKSPKDATTLAKIGTIEDARGNAPLAEKAFDMAHAADPQDSRIAERLARLYLRDGKTDNAAEIYLAVLSRDPNRTRALDGMGEVCVARNGFDEAVHYFDRALASEKPDRAAVLTHRGYAKVRLNDLVGAEADFRAALTVESRDDTWRYLGDLLARRGDNANALESLLHVMDTAQAYNEIGIMLMSASKFQDAKEYFSKAIKASPSYFEEAQKNLAVADEHLRNPSG
jgi:tetratricopeptide (TPR) repeat protein